MRKLAFRNLRLRRVGANIGGIAVPQIITGTAPILAAMIDGADLDSAVTWGSYSSSAVGGMPISVTREMQINGASWAAYVGSTIPAVGAVVAVRERVTDSASTPERIFPSGAVTVAGVAPFVTTPASISPSSGEVGTVFTFGEGVFGGTTPITIIGTLTLGGVDVTGDMTGSTYTPAVAGDLVWSVVASNGTSPDATSTAPTVTVSAVALPVNTAAPSQTGPATVGGVQTGNNGTWTNSPDSYLYKWRVSGGAEIAGATSASYMVDTAHEGTQLERGVAAVNAAGTTAYVWSAPSAVIAASGTATIYQATSVTHRGQTFNFFETDTTTPKTMDVHIQHDTVPRVISYGSAFHVKCAVPSYVRSGTFVGGQAYTGRRVNGAMLNPGNRIYATGGLKANNYYGTTQAYDDTPLYDGQSTVIPYNAANDVSSGVTLSQGTIRQAIHNPSPDQASREAILDYATLTITHAAPATDGELRPAPSSLTPASIGNVSTVDAWVASLSTRTAPASWSEDIDVMIAELEVSEPMQHLFGNNGRQIYPLLRGHSGYGRDYGSRMGKFLAAIRYDIYPLAKRQHLTRLLVQVGVDIQYRTYNEGGEYTGNGAHNNAREYPVALAALILGNSEMATNVDATQTVNGLLNLYRWHSPGQSPNIADIDRFARVDFDTLNVNASFRGTGYAVGDTFQFAGGVALGNVPPTFIVTQISGIDPTGPMLKFALHTKGWYIVLPQADLPLNTAIPFQTLTGSGSGARGGGRDFMLYQRGHIGIVDFGSNPYDPRSPNKNNAAPGETYAHTNAVAMIAQLAGAYNIPGLLAILNCPNVTTLTERFYWADTIPSETYAAWALEELASIVSAGPGTAPTVVSAGGDGHALWIKFSQYIKEKIGQRPHASNFTIKVGGVTQTITDADMVVLADTVTFGLPTALTYTSPAVTISYTPSAAPETAQSYSGGLVAAFTDIAVTNYSPPPETAIFPAGRFDNPLFWRTYAGVTLNYTDTIDPANPGSLHVSAAASGSGAPTAEGDADFGRFTLASATNYTMTVTTAAVVASGTFRFEFLFYDAAGAYLGYARVGGSTRTIASAGTLGPYAFTTPVGTAYAIPDWRKFGPAGDYTFSKVEIIAA